ncbi:alkaline shock response membrane anchor protein AmaP [Streptomyces sp. H10-C2]|uniref:alkaline shock response membrane anchor protein AmaP n=1 Tax=unclassified Streptomyces TaxID=2593676 RepID=UPI0024B9630E|nr:MULTISPECIES: alkaline shock response membrane anchor protein AmaP [unclassified Streptomyces]MDJ0344833.1 alkaline shock response membrane anchor protein AmaP [Streptomyces sp. PH10-H1]MDJ0371893.1 alkaline shock response membrane anchor protein AmaP [Streptomyces sp. H10-C2]
MRATLNRILLALVGLILLIAGLAVLVGSLDLQRRWGFTLPSWWPFTGPKDVLLTARDRTRYRGDGWWWPTVLGVLGAVVLAALWWLLAQSRSHRLRQLRIDSGDGQGAVLRGRALEDVLVAETQELDGVDRADAILTGTRTAPRARLTLGLAPHAAPDSVISRLDTDILQRAGASAGLPHLPAEARLRAVKHRATRVS